jgi:hypothetical protein
LTRELLIGMRSRWHQLMIRGSEIENGVGCVVVTTIGQVLTVDLSG